MCKVAHRPDDTNAEGAAGLGIKIDQNISKSRGDLEVCCVLHESSRQSIMCF